MVTQMSWSLDRVYIQGLLEQRGRATIVCMVNMALILANAIKICRPFATFSSSVFQFVLTFFKAVRHVT